MALHLVEIHLNMTSPESAKAALGAAQSIAAGRLPPGATVVAGPWVSNEEAKLVLVADLEDHSKTVGYFWPAMAQGIVTRRRFTPIVELSDVQEVVEKL